MSLAEPSLFRRLRHLLVPPIVYLPHYTVATLSGSVCGIFVACADSICHRHRPHVLQREPLELDPFLLALLRGVLHQPAQVRVPVARFVGLPLAVAENMDPCRALEG